MSFLDTIKRLTDAGERRAGQVRELRQKLAELETEYLAAIGADDDAAATKVRAKIAKIEDEIREKEAAIEAASSISARAQRDAAAQALAIRREAHDKDVLALIARATEFDDLVNGKAADLWQDIEQLYERCRLSADGLGVDFIADSRTKPGHLWSRVWLRFTQRTGRTLSVGAASKSSQIESVAELFRVGEAAAHPQRVE